MLQWGRGLTSAEIRQQTRGIAASHTCFNGAADLHPRMPRTYIRGNTHRPTSSHRSLSCFNGAADLHPRKYAIRKARAIRANLASMGPRTYIRGNAISYISCGDLSVASMGPRTYIRGNKHIVPVVVLEVFSFLFAM